MFANPVSAARSTGESTFAGRYHHWDSYPPGLGVALVELYRSHFKRDLDRMLQVLLDEHKAWSTIVHKDFTLKPGYTNVASRPEGMSIEDFHNLPLNRRPQCHCHGARHEEGSSPTKNQTAERNGLMSSRQFRPTMTNPSRRFCTCCTRKRTNPVSTRGKKQPDRPGLR